MDIRKFIYLPLAAAAAAVTLVVENSMEGP